MKLGKGKEAGGRKGRQATCQACREVPLELISVPGRVVSVSLKAEIPVTCFWNFFCFKFHISHINERGAKVLCDLFMM